MEILFSKMEGLGNDFVVMDDRDGQIRQAISGPELARKMCDRHFGIGADGIILAAAAPDSNHDIEFKIFNIDGSEAQMCGNGMRCFAKYLFENKILPHRQIRVATRAGTIVPEVMIDEKGLVASVKVDMGEPVLTLADIPFVPGQSRVHKPGREEIIDLGHTLITATVVSMGNPHAVVFVEDLARVDVETIGPAMEIHDQFPEKTNVEFVQVIDPNELKMKVWERGAGITLACGTGACASLVAAHLTGRADRSARIRLDGGDLAIFWDPENNHLYKTGPARLVFEGRFEV